MRTGFPSEYTSMIVVQTESADQGLQSAMMQVVRLGNVEFISFDFYAHECAYLVP